VRYELDSAVKIIWRIAKFVAYLYLPLTNFKLLRKCSSEFDTKINEVLLIKKLSRSLNKQLIGRGASLLFSAVASQERSPPEKISPLPLAEIKHLIVI